jgi:hypothetical protein
MTHVSPNFTEIRGAKMRVCLSRNLSTSCSMTLFQKIVPFMRYVEKYCRDGQATDDNMAHAHCILDN